MEEIVEDLGQETPARRRGQGDAPFGREKVRRQALEGEDGRVEGEAEERDVPERRLEFLDVAEDDLVAGALVAEVERPSRPACP